MQTTEPIVDFHDMIVYYDVDGNVLAEERILNSLHPHCYHTIRTLEDRKIDFKGSKYAIIESSIHYLPRKFGTLQITHLKLKPLLNVRE